MIIYVISFTDNGDKLNDIIQEIFSEESVCGFYKRRINENLSQWTKNAFIKADALIFIGAAGIAVRAIAPFIKGKDKDPAVVVCDELGKFAVPILSGHIGGANEIASKIADKIKSIPVITTATDINGVFAADIWAVKNNFKINNPENIKYISSALLRGERVGFTSDINIEAPKCLHREKTVCGVVVSPFIKNVYEHTLQLIPKCISIGVGSRKNADENALIDLTEEMLKKKNIDFYSIESISTIDIKRNEKSVIKLCKKFNIKPIFYSAEELNKLDGNFRQSQFVKETTGTDNVCERCCVKASDNGKIIIEKTKGKGVTVAGAIRTCIKNR